MSMFSYIQGIVNPERIEEAKHARAILQKLNLECPEELEDIIEETKEIKYVLIPSDNDKDIFEIDVKDIPEDVTKIRFINSY